jgi:hypothetical protein
VLSLAVVSYVPRLRGRARAKSTHDLRLIILVIIVSDSTDGIGGVGVARGDGARAGNEHARHQREYLLYNADLGQFDYSLRCIWIILRRMHT